MRQVLKVFFDHCASQIGQTKVPLELDYTGNVRLVVVRCLQCWALSVQFLLITNAHCQDNGN